MCSLEFMMQPMDSHEMEFGPLTAMTQPERYTPGSERDDKNQSVHRHLTTKTVVI